MLCGFNHRGFGELGRARATLRQPTARPMTSEHCTTLHNLTPAEFAPCCRHCIAGMNHDSGHIVKVKRDFAEVLALQCDHPFFSCDGQLVETDSLYGHQHFFRMAVDEGRSSDNGELSSTIAACRQQLAALRLTAASVRQPHHASRRHFTNAAAHAAHLQWPRMSVVRCMVAEGNQRFVLMPQWTCRSTSNLWGRQRKAQTT